MVTGTEETERKFFHYGKIHITKLATLASVKWAVTSVLSVHSVQPSPPSLSRKGKNLTFSKILSFTKRCLSNIVGIERKQQVPPPNILRPAPETAPCYSSPKGHLDQRQILLLLFSK